MQILKKILFLFLVSNSVFSGPGGGGISDGGGPGTQLSLNNIKSFSDGPGDSGGGGPGMSGDVLLSTKSFKFVSLGKDDNYGQSEVSRKLQAEVLRLTGVVDVRLLDDEVIDVQELQDRYKGHVFVVGDEIQITTKVPVVDFQNEAGEVIKLQQMHKIQIQN